MSIFEPGEKLPETESFKKLFMPFFGGAVIYIKMSLSLIT